jgi:Na+/melibiose symporter-like transporter
MIYLLQSFYLITSTVYLYYTILLLKSQALFTKVVLFTLSRDYLGLLWPHLTPFLQLRADPSKH